MAKPDAAIAQMADGQTLPRQNGELLFSAPWEARAFALAVALNQSGQYPWRDFSAALAEQTAAAEKQDRDLAYYERWLASLEAVLRDRGLVEEGELAARMAHLAAADDHGHTH